MEEYKQTVQNILLPSVQILSIQISSIIVADAILFSNTQQLIAGTTLCAVLLAISCWTIFLNQKNIKGPDIQKRLSSSISAQTLVMITIIIISIFPFHKAHEKSKSITSLKSATLHATVISIRDSDYFKNITISPIGHSEFEKTQGILKVKEAPGINAGDIIYLKKFKLKVLNSGNNTSSYEKNLIRQGIDFTIYASSKNIIITRKARPAFISRFRKHITGYITSTFSTDLAGFLKALYFGNKSSIINQTKKSFKEAGVFHVLAASGLHVGIIAMIPVLLLMPLKIDKRIITFIAILLVYCYLAMTDIPVSLLRAVIMMSIISIQNIFGLQRNSMNSLYVSAIIILFLFPWDIFNLGFQLSFGATFGILVFHPMYKKSLKGLKIPEIVKNMCSVTLAAQVLVIPIILVALFEINCVGIFSNIIIIPAVSLVLLLSVLTCAIIPLSSYISSILSVLTALIYKKIIIIVDLLASLGGHFHVEKITPILFIPFVFILLPLFPGLNKKKFTFISIALGYVLLWSILHYSVSQDQPHCTVIHNRSDKVVIYHSQKDIFIMGTMRNNQTVNSVLTTIRSSNYKSLSLFLPEADYRNLNSFSKIIEKTAVKTCYIDKGFRITDKFQKFCSILDKEKIALKIVSLSRNIKDSPSCLNSEINLPAIDIIRKIYTTPKNMLNFKIASGNISVNHVPVGSDNE